MADEIKVPITNPADASTPVSPDATADTDTETISTADDIEILDAEGNPLPKPKTDKKTGPKAETPIQEIKETVSTEDIISEDGNPEEVIKKLREKLKKATAEKQDYLDKWQRDKAEFINVRKREHESNAQYIKFAKEDLIIELIPVLDSFEMAFSNKEAWEKVDKNWRIGVEHIYSQLKGVLMNNNLYEVAPLGLKFDPMRDEATEFEPVTEERFDHMITKVIQKGYSLNGKTVKAPKVKVGEFKKPEVKK